jgi:hypothetical protein
MMQPTVREQFERYVAGRGGLQLLDVPLTGISMMLSFYREVRADQVEIEQDGDMLLFQWGTYDWGQGPHFEVDILRQLSLSEEGDDEDIWQLHLTYRVAPTSDLSRLGSGNQWCARPIDLPVFEGFVVGHEAVKAVSGKRVTAELHLECAG